MRILDPPVVHDERTAALEIGDYFSHRAGLPTGGGDDLEEIGYDRAYILDHLRMLPLNDFRITYNYSNFGLTTGAEAAASALGMSWEDAADSLLFEPLGMTSTSSSHDDFLAREDRAVLHAKVGDGFEPLYDRDPDPQAFFDLVQYGEVTRDWVSDMAGFFQSYDIPAGDLAEQTRPSSPAAPGPAADYAGTYTNASFGDLVVSVDGDGLVGALGPDGGHTFPIEPWDGDTWSFAP